MVILPPFGNVNINILDKPVHIHTPKHTIPFILGYFSTFKNIFKEYFYDYMDFLFQQTFYWSTVTTDRMCTYHRCTSCNFTKWAHLCNHHSTQEKTLPALRHPSLPASYQQPLPRVAILILFLRKTYWDIIYMQ